MKHRISLILIISILLCLCSCAKDTRPAKSPVNFYYLGKEISYDGESEILLSEEREGAGYEADVEGLLTQYLKGPISESLRSPFPANVSVSRYATTANFVILELSDEFAQLTGIDLTVACACLSRTLFDLTQLDQILISATGTQLDGQASISFDLNDIYFVDNPLPSGETSDATATPAP